MNKPLLRDSELTEYLRNTHKIHAEGLRVLLTLARTESRGSPLIDDVATKMCHTFADMIRAHISMTFLQNKDLEATGQLGREIAMSIISLIDRAERNRAHLRNLLEALDSSIKETSNATS